MQKVDQVQSEDRDAISMLPQQPIELAAHQQLRKGCSQVCWA